MKEILEKILKLLNKDHLGFTELKSIVEYNDNSYKIEHEALSPKRTIEVEFSNKKEALDYLGSF